VRVKNVEVNSSDGYDPTLVASGIYLTIIFLFRSFIQKGDSERLPLDCIPHG